MARRRGDNEEHLAKTAVILGAGASASEGAPLQGALFDEYVGHIGKRRTADPSDERLWQFFGEFFGVDVRAPGAGPHQFPTFEEALGILELAISQEERFRGRNGAPLSQTWDKALLQQVREDLILLIAEVLKERLRGVGEHHRRLLEGLGEEELRRLGYG